MNLLMRISNVVHFIVTRMSKLFIYVTIFIIITLLMSKTEFSLLTSTINIPMEHLLVSCKHDHILRIFTLWKRQLNKSQAIKSKRLHLILKNNFEFSIIEIFKCLKFLPACFIESLLFQWNYQLHEQLVILFVVMKKLSK